MRKSTVDSYKEMYAHTKKKKAVPVMVVLNKFFSDKIAKREHRAHGQVQVKFKDGSMCLIATYFNSIKKLIDDPITCY